MLIGKGLSTFKVKFGDENYWRDDVGVLLRKTFSLFNALTQRKWKGHT